MAVLEVEVVYALAHEQTIVRLALAPGSTVQDAVERSGILAALPRDLRPVYGVFGRRVLPEHALSDGDRVEVYRPLQTNPRTARRARAKRPRRTQP